MTKWNREKLKAAIRQDMDTLRKTKAELRQSGHQITWKEAADLRKAKLAATIHCAIAAHLRGRIHITKHYTYSRKEKGSREGFIKMTPLLFEKGMTLEQQADFIAEYVADFQAVEDSAATSAMT